MSVQNDNVISRPTMSETVSNSDTVQLLRNLLDRVDSSGNLQDSGYHLLTQAALNTNEPLTHTKTPIVVDDTGAKSLVLLIHCPVDRHICVFDFWLALKGSNDIKLTDADGNDIMGPCFAPDNGMRFVRNYSHGIILKKGKSLYYSLGPKGGDHGIEINYAII